MAWAPGASSYVVEQEFNRRKDNIQDKVFTSEWEPPTENEFRDLEREFKAIRTEYLRRNEDLNLAHVRHNFHLLAANYHLCDSPADALSHLVTALEAVLDREELRSYGAPALRKMAGVYGLTVSRILDSTAEAQLMKVTLDAERLLLSREDAICALPTEFRAVFSDLVKLILVRYYERHFPYWRSASVLRNRIARLLALENRLIRITPMPSLVPSVFYGVLYKLYRSELFQLVTERYANPGTVRAQEIETAIPEICDQLKEAAEESLAWAKRFYRGVSKETAVEALRDSVMPKKELDCLTSEYLKLAYADRDIYQASKKVDDIRKYLIQKTFREDIPFSQATLEYFEDEWRLLYGFLKLSLLIDEFSSMARDLHGEWQVKLVEDVLDHLDQGRSLFKYRGDASRVLSLRAVSGTFSGRFSEFMLHHLLREVAARNPPYDQVPEYLEALFVSCEDASPEEVSLNVKVDGYDPDVDLLIRGRMSLLVKNASMGGGAFAQVREEVKASCDLGVDTVLLVFNFMKNIKRLPRIQALLRELREDYPEHTFHVVDLRDCLEQLIGALRRDPDFHLNMSESNLYRAIEE